MDYEMDELVPIVGNLAEKYMAHESTSIPYEKAEQLMEAVLYCIHELEEIDVNVLALDEKIPAQRAYELGVSYVEEKTKKALNLYNKIIPGFCHYENQCLYDTFIKGIPEFFKWYDIRFEPQNTILCLDYPILKDLSAYTGIDQIYEFIKSIGSEQKFLKLFSEEYIISILSRNNRNWRDAIDNICEPVFACVMGHILAGKSLAEFQLREPDYSHIQEMFMQEEFEDIKKRMETAIQILVKNYYENDRELFHYLSAAVADLAVRLKNAVDHNVLDRII